LHIAGLEILLKPSRVAGRSEQRISGIADLAEAVPGELSFLSNPKYRPEVARSRASLILVPEDYPEPPRQDQVFFHCASPSATLGTLCRYLAQQQPKPARGGIHPTAILAATASVDPSATIGPYVVIGGETSVGEQAEIQAHAVIGDRCRIGAFSRIYPHVTLLDDTQIGKNVAIHPGCVIGSDGFGYETNAEGVHEKLPHLGQVIIEDDVEIGANTTIDRARFAATVIGRGSKIDNLVQVGHNVRIGARCLLVSQVGIAGSATLGDEVTLGGQVGIAGHLRIGRGSRIGAQSGVAKDIPPQSFLRGTPAMDYGKANRFYALRGRLPQLFQRLRKLEERLSGLEESKEEPLPATARPGSSH